VLDDTSEYWSSPPLTDEESSRTERADEGLADD
jgi:hypothetical protein